MPGRAHDLIVIPESFWQRPEVNAALRSRDIGRLFALVQQHTGASQTQIGIAIGWSQGKVSDLERGVSEVRHLTVFEQIADGLNLPDSARTALGLAPRESTHQPPDRKTSHGMQQVGRDKPEPAKNNDRPETPSFRIDQEANADFIDVLRRIQKVRKSTVDPDIIRHLRDSIRHTVTQYENLDHSILAPALRKQRTWTEALIDECAHPVQRKQLFEIAGTTSGVLGYVAVGSGDFPLARAYCLEAFHLGDFAGDANLQAWARGLQSFCEYYAGHYDEALILADDGLNYARSGPQSVRLKINGTARAMGKLRNVKGVDRAVDEAYELMSQNDAPEGIPSSIALGCYSAAQTASNAATAYVSLEIPEMVQRYVDLALPEISKSGSPWSRSLVLIDLAVSRIRAKESDLEQASTLVHDALSISAGRPIISVQQRALEFVREITGRWGNVAQAHMILDAIPVSSAHPVR